MADMITVQVVAVGKDFGKAVAYAKLVGGKYDGMTKTWQIPAQWEDNARLRGLKKVNMTAAATGRCPHYTVDQGCPLHGESCEEQRVRRG